MELSRNFSLKKAESGLVETEMIEGIFHFADQDYKIPKWRFSLAKLMSFLASNFWSPEAGPN